MSGIIIGAVLGTLVAVTLIIVVARTLGPDPHADLERRIMARRRAWEQADTEWSDW